MANRSQLITGIATVLLFIYIFTGIKIIVAVAAGLAIANQIRGV